MDVLHFSFQAEALKKIQLDTKQLSEISCSVLIEGSQGCGKSTWAEALCKKRGPYTVVSSINAPILTKDWKALFFSDSKNSLLLEDIDQWAQNQRMSLLSFLIKFESLKNRLVTTSSSSLEALLPQLYYRLATRKIVLPKPQECLEDFSSVCQFWIEVHSLVFNAKNVVLSDEAFSKVKNHHWRGGWSELIMVLERALSFCRPMIGADHIQFDSIMNETNNLLAGATLAEMEKKLILQTLQLTASNKSQAARILGISIRTLRNKLNEYKVNEFKDRGVYESI